MGYRPTQADLKRQAYEMLANERQQIEAARLSDQRRKGKAQTKYVRVAR